MALLVPTSEIRKFFVENKDRLSDEFMLVGTNESDGAEIYLTEENGLPNFSVEYDSETEYSETADSLDEIEAVYEEFVSSYICKEVMDDEDTERVNNIFQYTTDYLSAMMECDPDDFFDNIDVAVEEIALAFENFLYNEYGFSVRHPYDAGNGIVEYPCEEGIEY